MPRRALLAWELGGARGHVVKLATTANALQRRGFVNYAYLVRLDHADELAPYCESVEQAPPLHRRKNYTQRIGDSRFSEWLRQHRFDEPNEVRDAIDRWRAVIDQIQPDIVVIDAAPAALLAARTFGIPVVRIGVPSSTPPADMHCFPPFLPSDSAAVDDGLETRLRNAVNEAISPFGLPPLPYAPAISTVDDDIAASIELLDRYAPWRTRLRTSPITGAWQEPGERRRDEIFVYLSNRQRIHPVTLAAIGSLNLPLRIVLAGNPEAAAKAAGWRKAIVEERPVSAGEIARRARVLVHTGSHGISCLGLRAGLPHVTLPGHAEQVFNGRQLASTGAGITIERQRWTVPNIQAAIREAWESTAMTERAISLAEELAPEFEGDPAEMIADRIEAVIR